MSELIDRQDVIDRLKKAEDVFRQNGAKLEANGIHYALELVESDIEMPTIEPYKDLYIDLGYEQGYERGKNERPQGDWLITAEDSEGIHRIQCPFCRYEKGSDFIDYITVTFEKLPPFCESCGADMREEKRDEQTTD